MNNDKVGLITVSTPLRSRTTWHQVCRDKVKQGQWLWETIAEVKKAIVLERLIDGQQQILGNETRGSGGWHLTLRKVGCVYSGSIDKYSVHT